MSNKGKKVKVHYTGTLDDGTKFDSSVDRGEPIEFVCMAGQMIPGFDAAVEDMAIGEKKTVHIPAAEAYGERDDAMVQKVPVDQIPQRQPAARRADRLHDGPGRPALPRVRAVHRGRHCHLRHEPRAGGQGLELRHRTCRG